MASGLSIWPFGSAYRRRRKLAQSVQKGASEQEIITLMGPPDETIPCDWEAAKKEDGFESAHTMLVYRTGKREWWYLCMMTDGYSYGFTRQDVHPDWIGGGNHG